MSETFKMILENYKKESKTSWKDILNNKKIISDKEAEELNEILRELRKDKGWRL